jgi:hypothetical protein
MEQTNLTDRILLASATTTTQLFNVINIHILHYKLSQTSNSLTEKKIKVDTLCGTEGVDHSHHNSSPGLAPTTFVSTTPPPNR